MMKQSVSSVTKVNTIFFSSCFLIYEWYVAIENRSDHAAEIKGYTLIVRHLFEDPDRSQRDERIQNEWLALVLDK